MPPFLQDLLLASSGRMPDRIALVCGSQQVTYGQLVQRARALAATLESAGVKGADRVLIVADNSVEFTVSFWAVLMAGAVACPVHPSTPAGRLAWYLEDTQARAVLRNASLAGALAPAARQPRDDPTDLAAILYTSGSTGVPKGVMLSHANMLAAAQAIQEYLGYRADDVVLAALPMSFDYGLYQMILSIAAGARLLLEPSFYLAPQVVARMARERVTVFPGMPTVFAILAQFRTLSSYDLSSVRMVTSTGAPLGQEKIRWLQAAFPGAQLFSMYGLTECKRCSYLPPRDLARKPGSVGIPMPGLRFWAVDAQGERLPPDTEGELVVQGPTVMRGYWGDSQASAARLRPGPHGTVLHTGDLCRIDPDGYLHIVGRMDDMIKSRGERVAPREIEAALLEVPWVRDAVVIGVPDDVQGHAIKAFVIPEDTGEERGERELRDALRDRLEQRLIPSRFEFRDAFPLGPTGKTDRTQLRQASMLHVPGLVWLKPFLQVSAQAQCVVMLDAGMQRELEQAAPHRLARLSPAAAPQRRLEYLATRAAADALLKAHGCTEGEVENGPDRAPSWPAGFTGSIAHSPKLACVVVRPAAECQSIGIDAQDLLEPQAVADVARHCLRPGELEGCAGAGLTHQELSTLLFSAKEAFFKCVYPLVRRHFDYRDVQVQAIDVASGRLQVCILNSPGPGLRSGFVLAGSWCIALGHAFTAFELPAGGRRAAQPQAPTGV